MAMDRHRKLRDALDYLKEVLIQTEQFLCSCVVLHSYVRKHDCSVLGILTDVRSKIILDHMKFI